MDQRIIQHHGVGHFQEEIHHPQRMKVQPESRILPLESMTFPSLPLMVGEMIK